MPRVPTYRTNETFRAAGAANFGALRQNTSGQEMTRDLGAIGQGVIRQVQENDETNLLSFSNALLQNKQQLLNDPDSGFLNSLGIDAQNGRPQVQQQWQEMTQQAMDSLPARLQAKAKYMADKYTMAFDQDVAGHVRTQTDAFRKQVIADSVQKNLDEAAFNFGDLSKVDEAAEALEIVEGSRRRLEGLPDDPEATKAQSSKAYRVAIQTQLASDPYKAREMLEARKDRLAAADFMALQTSITNQIEVLDARKEREREQAEARAQRLQDKREAAALRAIDAYDRQIATGIQAPDDFYVKLADATRGTSQEGAFRERIQQEIEVRKVATLPPDQQRAYVQKLEAAQQRDGATVTQQANLARMKRSIESNLQLLRYAPLVYDANRTGQSVQPIDVNALLQGNADGVQAQIAERMVDLTAIRKRYGAEAGNSPLLPQEASALASAVAQATPKQVAHLFGTLNSAINDPDAYRAVMQQIAPDSPVRALAGIIYVRQKPAWQGGVINGAPGANAGDVAVKLLRGEALLNPGKAAGGEDGKGGAFKMPPPTDMDKRIADAVGDAFAGRPNDYRTALQAVRAYYAAASADAGDMTGDVDTDRLRESVRAVIGEPARVGGRDVIPPWGMDADTFEDLADLYIEARFKAAGIKNPGGTGLMNVRGRDGVYVLIRGMEPLTDKRGQPLIIRIGGRR